MGRDMRVNLVERARRLAKTIGPIPFLFAWSFGWLALAMFAVHEITASHGRFIWTAAFVFFYGVALIPAFWFAFFLIFVLVFLLIGEIGAAALDAKYFRRILVATTLAAVAAFAGIMRQALPQLAGDQSKGAVVTSHKTGVNFQHGLSTTTDKP
jgi:hypothetical protein